MFAVGVPVARHSPHRSRRALLTHRAPASGNNADSARDKGGKYGAAESISQLGMKRTIFTLLVVFVSSLALSFLTPAFGQGVTLSPPLERNNYAHITSSADISEYLDQLDRQSSLAQKKLLGQSAGGRPLEALILAEEAYLAAASSATTPDRLTVLLIGSQHGAEPSGAEALLFIARDLLTGSLRHILVDTDVILIPNANPDGREARRRTNANSVNISTDFMLLSQPESRESLGHCKAGKRFQDRFAGLAQCALCRRRTPSTGRNPAAKKRDRRGRPDQLFRSSRR